MYSMYLACGNTLGTTLMCRLCSLGIITLTFILLSSSRFRNSTQFRKEMSSLVKVLLVPGRMVRKLAGTTTFVLKCIEGTSHYITSLPWSAFKTEKVSLHKNTHKH